jgi:hypothetical protein
MVITLASKLDRRPGIRLSCLSIDVVCSGDVFNAQSQGFEESDLPGRPTASDPADNQIADLANDM